LAHCKHMVRQTSVQKSELVICHNLRKRTASLRWKTLNGSLSSPSDRPSAPLRANVARTFGRISVTKAPTGGSF
jgi:hypothetical protein